MSQDDRKPLEVDTSLSLDGKTMTAGAAAKLSLPQRFFEFFFSRRVVNNAALRALTDDIDRKLAAGVPLSELTPAQHQLLRASAS